MPEMPYPSIIAPMYFGGSMPPRAKVEACTMPPMIPKTTRMDMSAAKAAPYSKALVTKGSTNINIAITMYPPEILN